MCLPLLVIVLQYLSVRSTVQASTKFSPFKMLCGREPVLPIDVKHEFADCTSDAEDPELDEPDFHAALAKLETLQVLLSTNLSIGILINIIMQNHNIHFDVYLCMLHLSVVA